MPIIAPSSRQWRLRIRRRLLERPQAAARLRVERHAARVRPAARGARAAPRRRAPSADRAGDARARACRRAPRMRSGASRRPHSAMIGACVPRTIVRRGLPRAASLTGRLMDAATTCARPCAGDLQPGRTHFVQQAADFVQRLRLVGRIRLHEAHAHVFVERVEVGRDRAARLHVEAVAQLVDDRDRAMQQLRFLGAAAVRSSVPRAFAMRSSAPSMSMTIRRCGSAASMPECTDVLRYAASFAEFGV